MDSRNLGRIALAVLVAATACAGKEGPKASLPAAAASPESRTVEVRTATVAAQGEVVTTATGTLYSAQETLIMGEVPGKLMKLHAEEGDLVEGGQALVELDTTDFKIGLRNAEAQARGAELTLATMRLEFDRIAKLKEEGAVTQSMYDGMKLKLDLTANGLDQAKLGLEMARRRLAQATIRAPYDALIVNRLASVGTQVQVMPPTVVYRIQDAKNLRLKMRVPESVLRNVAVGDVIEARVDSAGLDVVARVDAVVTSVEPQLRTFEIVANLDNEAFDGKLRPGMFATVRIRHPAPEGAPILARENTLAVPGRPDEVRVFLLDGGKARERVVKVQSLDAATLIVTEGLKAGDLLVASDLASLRDGTDVKAGDAR